jgi:hypothetical protein
MRSLFGVSASLALMAAVVLAFFVPLSVIMGPERALEESGFVFNNLWVGLTMVACLIAACAGGWFVHRLSGSTGAVAALVVVVTLLGLADAAWHQWLMPLQWLASVPQAWYEMLLIAREPLWYDLTLPVLMAIFIWVAGSSRAVEHPAVA